MLSKNNQNNSPTGIFHNLMRNEKFARRYLRRAKTLLADDGMLGQQSVVEVWDSLYNTIATALYAEAARWGDYRRDVHPYQSRGQLYTVDNHYMTERNRLLSNYFPMRSQRVLGQIESFVNIDDFEAPDGWEQLTASMFHEWDGTGASAQPLNKTVNVDWNIGKNVSGGDCIAGFVGVAYNQFADITPYGQLVLRGSGSRVRILSNRLLNHGPYKQTIVSFNENDPYWNNELGVIMLPLTDIMTAPTNEGVERHDDFVHLNAIKVEHGSTANVSAIYLVKDGMMAVEPLFVSHDDSSSLYDLQGRKVSTATHLKPGIYIKNGKKIAIK